LFSGITGRDALAGLLPARHGEMPRRRQPVGQNGEGPPARKANPTPYPNAFVLVIVRLAQSSAVANDCVVAANRAKPRQKLQGHYPGSVLSLLSGSAIKRTTAGVKARR
jgi:hypothetical protein